MVAERPAERDLLLDAVDDAYRQILTQHAKNFLDGTVDKTESGVRLRAAHMRRETLLAMLDDKT